MLLDVPGGPYRPGLPTIVQFGVNRSLLSTPMAATTPGNLLLYAMTQRQAAAHAPTDGETWTTFRTGQFQWAGGSDENGIGFYGCVCTVSKTGYSTASLTNAVMWEIANSSLVGITSGVVSDHASSTAVDLGALGSLDATRLAFALFGNGSDGTSLTVTPGVWVRDYFVDRDHDSGGTETLGAGGAFPQSYYAHTIGAGIAVQARIDLSVAEKSGGIYVLLA